MRELKNDNTILRFVPPTTEGMMLASKTASEKKLISPGSILDQSQLLQLLRTSGDISTESAVFDLDNTTIIGDIGDAVFAALDKLGMLAPVTLCDVNAETGNTYRDLGVVIEHYSNETFNAFYERAVLLARNSWDCDRVTASIYMWMTACQAHLSCEQITAVTRAVWYRYSSENKLGHQHSVETRDLTLRSEVVEVIATLLELGAKVCIVSATNQFTVSWIIEEVLNPALKSRGACLRIATEDVYGMRCSPNGVIEFPASTFSGKSALVRARISNAPLVVAGDSRNDFAMLKTAKHRLWISRNDRTEEHSQFISTFSHLSEGTNTII